MSQNPPKRVHHIDEDSDDEEDVLHPSKVARKEDDGSNDDEASSSASESSSGSSTGSESGSSSDSSSSEEEDDVEEEEEEANVSPLSPVETTFDDSAQAVGTCPLRGLRNFDQSTEVDEQLFNINDFINQNVGPVDPVFIDEDSSGDAAAVHVDLDDPSNEAPDFENSSKSFGSSTEKSSDFFQNSFSRRRKSSESRRPPLPSQSEDSAPPPPLPPSSPVATSQVCPPPPPPPETPSKKAQNSVEHDAEQVEHLVDDESTSNLPEFIEDIGSSDDDIDVDEEDYDGDSVDDNDEIFALIEESVETQKQNQDEEPGEHSEKIRYTLIEKNKNPFEVLPLGWISINHRSGLPVYMHKATKVVTFSRPYYIGRRPLKGHKIPISAIPCFNYRKGIEKEEQVVETSNDNVNPAAVEATTDATSDVTKDPVVGDAQAAIDPTDANADAAEQMIEPTSTDARPSTFPVAQLQEASESHRTSLLTADELREYCQNLFQFKETRYKKFRSWMDHRRNRRREQSRRLRDLKQNSGNAQTLPEGTKIITIPVVEMTTNDNGQQANGFNQQIIRKSKKEWCINPANKSTVCILHEYLQHSLKQAPIYKFSEVDSAATPYCATIEINGVEYGKGFGSSKKIAKSEAARLTLELLIPEFRNVTIKNGSIKQESVDETFFDNIRIEDPRVPQYCNLLSEPSPYIILLTCLQKNYGLGDTSITTSMVPARNQQNEFKMKISEKEVSVICKNKRDGKQMASQKMLQLLHPNVKSWGSLVRMYGSKAISAQKLKKERENEVTVLQSRTLSQQSPSKAILEKLRSEMRLLHARKKHLAPLGKLTLPSEYSSDKRSCIDKIDL